MTAFDAMNARKNVRSMIMSRMDKNSAYMEDLANSKDPDGHMLYFQGQNKAFIEAMALIDTAFDLEG
jgi:hypothetical protein